MIPIFNFLFHFIKQLYNMQCISVKFIPRFGRTDVPSNPLKETGPVIFLHLFYGKADGRLSEMQNISSLCNAVVFIYRDEYFHISERHNIPSSNP